MTVINEVINVWIDLGEMHCQNHSYIPFFLGLIHSASLNSRKGFN